MIARVSTIAAATTVYCATAPTGAQTFVGGPIAIPDIGPANPYPSVINVSGVVEPITVMSVTISGFTHTFGDDVGLLLVGPNGNALILADGPGDGAASDLTWVFADSAATMLPNSGPLSSGTFQPGQNQYDDIFTAPAPVPALWFNSFASAFGGSSPNGVWNLYVEDFVTGDSGSIASWSMTFGVPSPGGLALAVAIVLMGSGSARRR